MQYNEPMVFNTNNAAGKLDGKISPITRNLCQLDYLLLFYVIVKHTMLIILLH